MSSRKKRPQCAEEHCGSRRFHTGDDGFTYCSSGHQQSGSGPIISQDTGELIITGPTSRLRADSGDDSATSRHSATSGTKAFEIHLLCMQLVLRKQLRWLIEAKSFPEELEGLVKDLWALRMHRWTNKLSHDTDTDTEAQSQRMFSSQSEGESGTDAETVASRRSQALRKQGKGPNLVELLCLTYTGITLLKIPITITDLHKWINDGDLLYYRAAKEVPLSMRERLPGYYQEVLEPQDLLQPETLHRQILSLAGSLNTDHGMAAPNLNHPLVLYRWIRNLSLPLETYVASQRLGRLLKFDFGYTLDAKPRSSTALRFPEVRLMTLVVIATKLLFPFDNIERFAQSSDDLSALKMDWAVWTKVHNQDGVSQNGQGETSSLSFQEAFTMTEAESMDMADDRLDEYLNWYEGNIASEEVRERGRAGRDAEFRRALFRLFPTGNRSSKTRVNSEVVGNTGNTSAAGLIEVQGALRPIRIIPDKDSDDYQRTGSSFSQFRAVDELHGASRTFYDKASQLAGVSLHGMVRSVFLVERKLMHLEKDWKKLSPEEEIPASMQ